MSEIMLKRIKREIRKKLNALHTRKEINDFIREKYNKSKAQADRYITEAFKEIPAVATRDIESVRAQNQHFILQRVRINLGLCMLTHDIRYEKLAMDWYDKYLRLCPNGLTPEDLDGGGPLTIVFNKIEGKR